MPPKVVKYRESVGFSPRVRTIGQASIPFEDLYHQVLARSWGVFFAVVAVVYLLLNGLFAALYTLVPGSLQGARPGSFEDAFFFSVQTFSTVGYGAMAPAGRYANGVMVIESITALLCTALVTGIAYAKFARPRARVLFSDKLVLHERNGVPHLEARMANWRHNQLLEVEVKMLLLVNEVTREGEKLRRQYVLPLVRDRSAFFWLTFTVMHPIIEGSPLAGEGAREALRSRDASLMITLRGIDETLAQEVHARMLYRLEDIAENARFADVLSADPDGTRVVDYTRFHEVTMTPGEPTETPPAPPRSAG